ncbi:MAG TPA: PEGA domain-containing protein [Polyangia bacterium]|nr:PEGA domain-containing protein [Polyangia bacterium]
MISLLGASTAHAAEDAEPAKVEDLIRRGIELRRSDHDNRALPLFQEAYERAPSPRTAAQLGLVEMALGYKLEAERHLAEAVGSRRDLWVNKNRGVLEESLTTVRAAIGEVVITGPSGADVTVSGKNVGRLPMVAPLRLGEGPATIEAAAPGYRPDRQSVTVVGGKQVQVTFNLQRDVTPAPPGPSGKDLTSQPPSLSATADTTEPVRNDSAENRWHRYGRPAAWSTAVGALALLGFGILETVATVNAKNKFEQHVGPLADNPSKMDINCGAADPGHGGPGCDPLYQDLQRKQTLAIVGYAAGGLMAVGSGLLFWASSSTPGDFRASAGLACAPSWPAGGVSCRLTF